LLNQPHCFNTLEFSDGYAQLRAEHCFATKLFRITVDSPRVLTGDDRRGSQPRHVTFVTSFFGSQYIAPPSLTLFQTSGLHPPSRASPTDAFFKKYKASSLAHRTERTGACMVCMAPANGGVIATLCSAASAATQKRRGVPRQLQRRCLRGNGGCVSQHRHGAPAIAQGTHEDAVRCDSPRTCRHTAAALPWHPLLLLTPTLVLTVLVG
jgi:hypothetical protein